MASSSRTWFYDTPENNAYLLQERVNSNLWMARVSGVFFVAETTEPPFRMTTTWQGQQLTLEWEPGAWLRLTSEAEASGIASAFSNILQLPAAFTYTDNTGQVITEWHTDGGDARWREIQGNPSFQSPVRLGRK